MFERSYTSILLVALCACRAAEEPAPTSARQPKAEAIAMVPIVPPAREEPKAVERVHALPVLPAAPAPQAAHAPAIAVEPRAQRFEALKAQFEREQEAYFDLFRNAKSDEEMKKISETAKPPDAAAFGRELQPIFDEDPSDDTAFDILQWALGEDPSLLDRTKACAALEKFHFARAELEQLVGAIDLSRTECLAALVAKLGEASPHAAVRGTALYRLALAKKDEAEQIRWVKGLTDEKERQDAQAWLGEKRMQMLANSEPDAAEAAAIALLERVAKDYRDVPQMAGTPRETTLGKRADGELFELRNLVPGKPAPEIGGQDLNGVAFKLSDYRGKVVMLDFWGYW